MSNEDRVWLSTVLIDAAIATNEEVFTGTVVKGDGCYDMYLSARKARPDATNAQLLDVAIEMIDDDLRRHGSNPLGREQIMRLLHEQIVIGAE